MFITFKAFHTKKSNENMTHIVMYRAAIPARNRGNLTSHSQGEVNKKCQNICFKISPDLGELIMWTNPFICNPDWGVNKFFKILPNLAELLILT